MYIGYGLCNSAEVCSIEFDQIAFLEKQYVKGMPDCMTGTPQSRNMAIRSNQLIPMVLNNHIIRI